MTDPGPNRSPAEEMTDPSYWDDEWSRAGSLVAELRADDYYFGADGLFARLVRRRLGDVAGRRIVEFGGGGPNLRLLAMAKWMGAHVTAVDYSPVGIGTVRRLFELNGCAGQFVESDAQHWTPEEPFDHVVHWGVLEHFADPLPLLAHSARCLRPGATLLFSMPNMEAMGAGLWRRWSPENWSRHVFHPDQRVLACLDAAGFDGAIAFHFGVPCIKMAPWEHPGRLAPLVDAAQKGLSAAARVLPVFDRVGHRRLSMERGFLAVRR